MKKTLTRFFILLLTAVFWGLPLMDLYGQCQQPAGGNEQYASFSCNQVGYDLQRNINTLGNSIESSFRWFAVKAVGSDEAFDHPQVSGESTSPRNSTTIDDELTNFSGSQVAIIYRVEPVSKADNCAGDPFFITIVVAPRLEVTGCVACNDTVLVTLDMNCEAALTVDMVAEGYADKFSECENYELLKKALRVVVFDEDYDGAPDNVINKCGTFNYHLELKEEYKYCFVWEHCWGVVVAEDKSPPVVKAPSPVNGLKKAFDEVDPEYGTYDFWPGFGHGDYQDKPDYFNYLTCTDFEKIYGVEASWNDHTYAWYTGAPIENKGWCINNRYDPREAEEDFFFFRRPGCADDACGTVSLLDVSDELTLDLSTCDANRDLLLDLIAFYAGYEYGAEVEASIRLHYWAIEKVIARTFTYVDEKGNVASDVQHIFFQRPYIQLPLCKVPLELCEVGDEADLSPEGLIAMGEEQPAAAYAVPFFYDAVCEKQYITDYLCNFTLSYTDEEFPAPEDCGRKIVRTWSVLDGCWRNIDSYPFFLYQDVPLWLIEYYDDKFGNDGPRVPDLSCYEDYEGFPFWVTPLKWEQKRFTWEQHIVVGDHVKPEVSCPFIDNDWDGEPDVQTISTGPFNCTAVVSPEPPNVEGECKDWTWSFEIWGTVKDPKTGLESDTVRLHHSTNGVASGVKPGFYTLKYLVEDACGNRGEVKCPLLVVDQIEPVAKCDDQLNVSMGGANMTAEGLARLHAADVDEGSTDNCGPVDLLIRRQVKEDCVETYLQLVEKVDGLASLYLDNESCDNLILYRKSEEGEIVLSFEEGVYYSRWAKEVFFTCCDVTDPDDDSDDIIIELLATDNGSDNYDRKGAPVFEPDLYCFEGADNSGTCWMTIDVEDKLPPRCEVHDLSILCTELDFDPADSAQVAARFGAPEEVVMVLDNCGATISEEVVWTPGACGTGIIERVFTITDGSGLRTVCTQTITVEEVNHYEMKFPGDEESTECGLAPETEIIAQSFACDLLAINRDTTRFAASGDECFKLRIDYQVLNWCEYDGVETAPTVIRRDYDGDGNFEECTWVEVDYSDPDEAVKIFVDATGSTKPGKPYETYTLDEYLGRKVIPSGKKIRFFEPGLWRYSQWIKVYDQIAPEVRIQTTDLDFCTYGNPAVENGCDGPVKIVLSANDNCTLNTTELRSIRLLVNRDPNFVLLPESGKFKVEKSENTYTISGILPVGDHRFLVQIADGCGNLNGKTIDFSVSDCKAPAPICINGVAIELMPVDENGDGRIDGGMNTVWATDFIASQLTDCSGEVTYSINRIGEAPDREATSLVVTCDDPLFETIPVEIHAWDELGNHDYCETFFIVEDLQDLCDIPQPAGGIAGLILTDEDEPVENVSVSLSGQLSLSVVTGADGFYRFNRLEEGYDYSVKPHLDKDYLNGVSTFDLVLISKHILGIKPFASPYRMIAADVNRSGSVTTLDMIQLRKVILNLDTRFNRNTSWRFVPASYEFPDPANPFAAVFPEVLNYNDLIGEWDRSDFVAIKVGDVNSSARVSTLVGGAPRSVAGTFEISLEDQQLESGNEYKVVFQGDLSEVQGYQFSLNFDPSALELVDLIEGAVTDDHFGLFAEEGLITTSWHSESQMAAGKQSLFSLVLRARSGGLLSELLRLESRPTAAEAYDHYDEQLDVSLRFGDQAALEETFALHPNRPNPWREGTLISFTLPEAGEATLRISDVSGRLIKIIRGNFAAGYNELKLDRGSLPAGVLYYTLQTGAKAATRKMVIIE